jgi:hypothetical protein
MRQIELSDGLMVCVVCKGFIEADKEPSCECLDENFLILEAVPHH